MRTPFSEQEKDFFRRQENRNSKFKFVIIAVMALLIFGLLLDAFNGFYILREAKSLIWGIGGLLLLAIFYLIGESGARRIDSKDDVSHPLHKRVFHLVILLCFAGVVMASCWFLFKYLGW